MSEIMQKIQNNEMILVGIGGEWSLTETADARQKVLEAYKNLAFLLKEKDYFIITLTTDNLISEVFSVTDRVVSPCGNSKRWQCPSGCDRQLWLAGSAVVCPKCGKHLVENTVKAPVYVEEGYLPQWEHYTKWLQGTLNKKLFILELGTDFSFPSVIRWPFEKTAYFNQKAELWRVSQSYYQLPEELKEQAMAIAVNSVDYILQNLSFFDK